MVRSLALLLCPLHALLCPLHVLLCPLHALLSIADKVCIKHSNTWTSVYVVSRLVYKYLYVFLRFRAHGSNVKHYMQHAYVSSTLSQDNTSPSLHHCLKICSRPYTAWDCAVVNLPATQAAVTHITQEATVLHGRGQQQQRKC